jgi:hypothetical protein
MNSVGDQHLFGEAMSVKLSGDTVDFGQENQQSLTIMWGETWIKRHAR